MIELLKTEALADKAAVIRLQNEVLQSKDKGAAEVSSGRRADYRARHCADGDADLR